MKHDRCESMNPKRPILHLYLTKPVCYTYDKRIIKGCIQKCSASFFIAFISSCKVVIS